MGMLKSSERPCATFSIVSDGCLGVFTWGKGGWVVNLATHGVVLIERRKLRLKLCAWPEAVKYLTTFSLLRTVCYENYLL
jgi:hypothetical protein